MIVLNIIFFNMNSMKMRCVIKTNQWTNGYVYGIVFTKVI